MNQEIKPAELFANLTEGFIDVFLFRYVARQQQRTGHRFVCEFLDILFQAIALVSESEVRTRLFTLRRRSGRSAPQIARGLDRVLAEGVARIESGVAPKEALDQVPKKSMDVVARGRVSAWFVSTSSVDKLEYPPDLLLRPSLRLGVGVAKYRREGSPWTRLGVLLVAVEDAAALRDAARPAEP